MYACGVILIAVFAVQVNGLPQPRIVGGVNAPKGKYPFMASVQLFDSHVCGGSILNERYILTAAHCLDKKYIKYTTVRVGMVDLVKEHYDEYQIEKMISHKEYIANQYYHDIGLIRVTRDIRFNDKVQPVKLPTMNYIPDGQVVTAIGWGWISAMGTSTKSLQQIYLTVISLKKCKDMEMSPNTYHVCTLQQHGEGVCNGDSGGPLLFDGVQVGIVSYGKPCARYYPDVYTRVYSYKPWIEEQLISNGAGSVTASILMTTMILILRAW